MSAAKGITNFINKNTFVSSQNSVGYSVRLVDESWGLSTEPNHRFGGQQLRRGFESPTD